MAAKGTFLTSLNTYILKLGGKNLRGAIEMVQALLIGFCLSARLRMGHGAADGGGATPQLIAIARGRCCWSTSPAGRPRQLTH